MECGGGSSPTACVEVWWGSSLPDSGVSGHPPPTETGCSLFGRSYRLRGLAKCEVVFRREDLQMRPWFGPSFRTVRRAAGILLIRSIHVFCGMQTAYGPRGTVACKLLSAIKSGQRGGDAHFHSPSSHRPFRILILTGVCGAAFWAVERNMAAMADWGPRSVVCSE